MARFDVELKQDALRIVAQSPECKAALTAKAEEIAGRANAMSSSFRTLVFYRNHKATEIGNTQPKYESDQARNTKDGAVALVYTGNYSAMKENHLHNTLLKAKG